MDLDYLCSVYISITFTRTWYLLGMYMKPIHNILNHDPSGRPIIQRKTQEHSSPPTEHSRQSAQPAWLP
jgi:hypothetical protein